MSTFNGFRDAVDAQLHKMALIGDLFTTKTSKDERWDTYIESFPDGSNPKYRERTEHDCQCCKQFIRALGAVVCIDDSLNFVSIWDVDIGGDYQVVADALSALVKSKPIENVFLHYEKQVGAKFNHQLLDSGTTIKWEHFFCVLPPSYVKNGASIPSLQSDASATKLVLWRGLAELTTESINTVLWLIEQKHNPLYRGEEYLSAVREFSHYHSHTITLNNEDAIDKFAWVVSTKAAPNVSRLRNTAIGTLLVDLSDGVELNRAVRAFEDKVAPENFKRTTAIATTSMIKKAHQQIIDMGAESSLVPSPCEHS